MTEAEWLASADPNHLLSFMLGRLSDRKLRLFACACCGPVWERVTEACCRAAVAVALRFADGEATREELHTAYVAAQNGKPLFQDANWAAAWTADPLPTGAAYEAASMAALTLARQRVEAAKSNAWGSVRSGATEEDRAAAWSHFDAATEVALAEERAWQAELVRELAGNPFRPTPTAEGLPTAVTQLAEALYAGEACAFALHDALEEAGHGALAEHFLFADHPRGCWALDRILGRS